MIATFDGIYFHLYKYRLYAKKESKKEHLLHTANCFLFPFTILFIFLDKFNGIFFWIGIFLTLLTLIIEFLDVFEENKSRKKIGGLTSLEYSMHFAMSGLRATYTTLILVSKPSHFWFTSSYNYQYRIDIIDYFIYPVAFIGVMVFLLHFILIFYKNESVNEI